MSLVSCHKDNQHSYRQPKAEWPLSLMAGGTLASRVGTGHPFAATNIRRSCWAIIIKPTCSQPGVLPSGQLSNLTLSWPASSSRGIVSRRRSDMFEAAKPQELSLITLTRPSVSWLRGCLLFPLAASCGNSKSGVLITARSITDRRILVRGKR